MVSPAATSASKTKPKEAQRQAPVGTPRGAAERDREASINARIPDLVNQSFPTLNMLILLDYF
jgi:hypothetical protein